MNQSSQFAFSPPDQPCQQKESASHMHSYAGCRKFYQRTKSALHQLVFISLCFIRHFRNLSICIEPTPQPSLGPTAFHAGAEDAFVHRRIAFPPAFLAVENALRPSGLWKGSTITTSYHLCTASCVPSRLPTPPPPRGSAFSAT